MLPSPPAHIGVMATLCEGDLLLLVPVNGKVQFYSMASGACLGCRSTMIPCRRPVSRLLAFHNRP